LISNLYPLLIDLPYAKVLTIANLMIALSVHPLLPWPSVAEIGNMKLTTKRTMSIKLSALSQVHRNTTQTTSAHRFQAINQLDFVSFTG
jgi:hypothetical protein